MHRSYGAVNMKKGGNLKYRYMLMNRKGSIFIFKILLIIFINSLHVHGAVNNSLRTGIAKVNITPEGPVQMAGYSNRKTLSKGVHDSLFARVLVLDDGKSRLAIISCDLIGYANDHIIEIAQKKFNIPVVLFNSIHTHSGPDFGASGSYSRMVEQKIINGLEHAVKNLFAARIAAGYRSFPQLGYNRLIIREDGRAHAPWYSQDKLIPPNNPERVPFGPVDPEAGVIRIDDMNGNPRIIIMTYACHAVTNAHNSEISADYPGVAVRIVEKEYDGKAVGIFINGASGNIAPFFKSPNFDQKGNPYTDYTQKEKMGALLADNIIKLSRELATPDKDPGSLKVFQDSIMFTGRFDKSISYNIHFNTILINDKIAIATFPGEPFVRFQLFWKENAEVAYPVFFGYTSVGGDDPGYVPDIRSSAYGGYGADSDPDVIETGAGEIIMNRHLENLYRLKGIMRDTVGEP
jgi:hypothetical protein